MRGALTVSKMMIKNFLLPRGTADILPQEISRWHELEQKARIVCKNYGYREIRTPAFEETELFARSVGQTSDIVQKQLLSLASQKEGDGSNSPLSLRPEGTASIVRAYLQHNFIHTEPISKFYYLGPMFRGERPQKGRLRQFHQLGVELIGPAKQNEDLNLAFLDAEVIGLCVQLLRSFGVKGFKVKINTLGTPQDKQAFSSYLRQCLKEDLKSLAEEDQKRFSENIFRILDSKKKECQQIVKKIDFGKGNYFSEFSQKYFEKAKSALRDLQIDFEEVPYLVRGLDYYNHIVFEVSHEALGSQDALAAGGRYDTLVHQLGADPKTLFSALGFAIGIERVLLVADQPATPTTEVNAFVLAMDEKFLQPAFCLVNELRQAGISADVNYQLGSIKSQMRLANKRGAKQVVIFGEEEMKEQAVSIKDMEEGQQNKIALNQVVDYLSKIFIKRG